MVVIYELMVTGSIMKFRWLIHKVLRLLNETLINCGNLFFSQYEEVKFIYMYEFMLLLSIWLVNQCMSCNFCG